MHRVGAAHVGLLEPAPVARDVGLRLDQKRAQVEEQEPHALGGERGAHRVHGADRRIQRLELRHLLRRRRDARILGVRGEIGRRDRVGRLPLQQRPHLGVEPEQQREQRGARARQADHHPRPLDPLLAHLGVARRPVDQAQARLERRRDAGRASRSARTWRGCPRARARGTAPRAPRASPGRRSLRARRGGRPRARSRPGRATADRAPTQPQRRSGGIHAAQHARVEAGVAERVRPGGGISHRASRELTPRLSRRSRYPRAAPRSARGGPVGTSFFLPATSASGTGTISSPRTAAIVP